MNPFFRRGDITPLVEAAVFLVLLAIAIGAI